MHDSDHILERLLKLHPKLIDLDLSRVARLLDRLGNPQSQLPPVIHVAGTNGKGSTIAFLKSILKAAGLQVHTYTSPHLVSFHERIELDGIAIEEERLSDLLEECERANSGDPITFFEITTVTALLAFSRMPADVVLLEVGLGGRFDATNVVDKPLLSVITPVAYDHQQFLGDTLTSIAGEKAGILKEGVPCVLGPQEEEAENVIAEHAQQIGAPLKVYGRDWSAHEENGRLVFQDQIGLIDIAPPRLAGRHQFLNAGLAIAALRAQHQFEISAQAIDEGVASANWPARLQPLTRGPLIEMLPQGAELWLDGGHNPHAAAALAQALGEIDERHPKPLYLVVGQMDIKDREGFFRPFADIARKIFTVPITGEAGAAHPEDLAISARSVGHSAEPAENVEDAITSVLYDAHEHPRIMICGSLYLAGRVLKENG